MIIYNYIRKQNEMITLVTDKESIIWASGHYLGEHLPEEYDRWGEEELDKYLLENAWQPFEHSEADVIWERITDLAYDFKLTVNNKLNSTSDIYLDN